MYFSLMLHEVSPCPYHCLEGKVLVLILVLKGQVLVLILEGSVLVNITAKTICNEGLVCQRLGLLH